MKTNKILSMLSIATKSGNVVSGEFATEKAVKSGSGYLVIVSTQASDNTKKKFHNMCEYYSVPIYDYAGKEELGHCIGKEFRASLAVTDQGLAKAIVKLLETEKLNNGGNE